MVLMWISKSKEAWRRKFLTPGRSLVHIPMWSRRCSSREGASCAASMRASAAIRPRAPSCWLSASSKVAELSRVWSRSSTSGSRRRSRSARRPGVTGGQGGIVLGGSRGISAFCACTPVVAPAGVVAPDCVVAGTDAVTAVGSCSGAGTGDGDGVSVGIGSASVRPLPLFAKGDGVQPSGSNSFPPALTGVLGGIPPTATSTSLPPCSRGTKSR
mmetsp:Transcript_26613/g.66683  ORF Transcript_26613/g.66683 Transcript_26613/m.66683 type:complete len:214 (-) Transcript_26613:449-1090(-)